MTNSRVQERPSSAHFKERQTSKKQIRPESPYRKSNGSVSLKSQSYQTIDPKRLSGMPFENPIASFTMIHQNLEDFAIMKEKIDVLKKKYN